MAPPTCLSETIVGQPLGLMTPLENRRAEVDVVDVQRLAVDVDVGALQAPLFAGLPRQVVLGVVDDGKPAEDRVAELVAAQPRAGAMTQPIPSAGADFLDMARAARPGADDLLQRDDIGVDVAQHGGDPIGTRAPIHAAASDGCCR